MQVSNAADSEVDKVMGISAVDTMESKIARAQQRKLDAVNIAG